MFDGAARLVVCNARYIEMSQLSPEIFRKGTPLREILIRRAQAGTFAGDPDQYVVDVLKQTAEGRTEAKTLELEDGRTIALVVRPLLGGGWVSTHTDVTQQRAGREGARFTASTRRTPRRHRCGDRRLSRPHREHAHDRRAECRGHEDRGQVVAIDIRPHAAAGRRRGARIERGIGQRRNRGCGRRGTVRFDQGDQPPARADERNRAQRHRSTRPSPTTTSPRLPKSRRGSATW